jgi:hypothetical protein
MTIELKPSFELKLDPGDIFDGSQTGDLLAQLFLATRLTDYVEGRLRFPETLSPDQYADFLIGQAATVAFYGEKYKRGLANA